MEKSGFILYHQNRSHLVLCLYLVCLLFSTEQELYLVTCNLHLEISCRQGYELRINKATWGYSDQDKCPEVDDAAFNTDCEGKDVTDDLAER